jgi:hypothetical protein
MASSQLAKSTAIFKGHLLSGWVDGSGGWGRKSDAPDGCRPPESADGGHDKNGGKGGQKAPRTAKTASGACPALGGVPRAAKCRFYRA